MPRWFFGIKTWIRKWPPAARLGVSGLLIAVPLTGLALLSPQFDYARRLTDMPIVLMVSLFLFCGAIYALALKLIWRLRVGKKELFLIFGLGLLFRLAFLPTTPMLEDDYYRYLWDGAVTAQGMNPFRYAPEDIMAGPEVAPQLPGRLFVLAKNSGKVIQRINHPHIRTIYPPVAQAAFTLAFWIKPWSLLAWKSVLLVAEILVFFLLLLLLRQLAWPMIGLAVYWWNPLVIKEVYNSAHMDILILPFLLGALLLASRARWIAASAALALAAGVKVWPVLLLPVILRSALRRPVKLIISILVFLVLALGMFLPIHLAGLDSSSGFTAYSGRWEMNDALFMALLWLGKGMVRWLGQEPHLAGSLARYVIIALLALVVLKRSWRVPDGLAAYTGSALVIIAVLFFLSPTQFPWYYLWVMPLLALYPRPSLILMSMLLPIYYLRFYFKSQQQVGFFDNVLVWIEYAPVWALMLWEWRRVFRGAKKHAE